MGRETFEYFRVEKSKAIRSIYEKGAMRHAFGGNPLDVRPIEAGFKLTQRQGEPLQYFKSEIYARSVSLKAGGKQSHKENGILKVALARLEEASAHKVDF